MTTAKDFFAGMYQDAPKPVLVFDEKDHLIYANGAAERMADRFNSKDTAALLTPHIHREAARCLRYYRGISDSDRLNDHVLNFFLQPYPYEEQLFAVVHVEEQLAKAVEQQDLMRLLRNCQGKLNGYLNGIYARAQMLGLDTHEGGELGYEVRRILRMSNHLYQLLDREETYEYLVPVDAGSFTVNCVTTANEIDPAAQILMEPHEPGLYVRMMPEETELVLSTLLSNAMRFCKSMVAVRVTRKGEKIYITVRDDGPGVRDTEALFTWGYRSPDKYGMMGTGSGLAMAKKLLKLQGAELLYERVEEETLFHIVMDAESGPAISRLAEWHPETLENSLTQMQIELSDYIREENEK